MKYLKRMNIPDIVLELSPLLLVAMVCYVKIKSKYKFFMGRIIVTGLLPSTNQVGTMETIANVEMVSGLILLLSLLVFGKLLVFMKKKGVRKMLKKHMPIIIFLTIGTLLLIKKLGTGFMTLMLQVYSYEPIEGLGGLYEVTYTKTPLWVPIIFSFILFAICFSVYELYLKRQEKKENA